MIQTAPFDIHIAMFQYKKKCLYFFKSVKKAENPRKYKMVDSRVSTMIQNVYPRFSDTHGGPLKENGG